MENRAENTHDTDYDYRYLQVYVHYNEEKFSSMDEYKSFVSLYKTHAKLHNDRICERIYKDAGFDLLIPFDEKVHFDDDKPTRMIDLNISCSMYRKTNNGNNIPVSYFLYPRSSTGKNTPLRLANSVGIIDSGYRGHLMACVECSKLYSDFHMNHSYDIAILTGQRLFQLCAGDLSPIIVNVVDDLVSLNVDSTPTERGSGGFGSTGTGTNTEEATGATNENQRPLRQRHLNSQGMLVD
jgi:dUTP pyrophosphatase